MSQYILYMCQVEEKRDHLEIRVRLVFVRGVLWLQDKELQSVMAHFVADVIFEVSDQ